MNDGPIRGAGAIGPTGLATKPEGIDYAQAPKELVPCACCGSTRHVVAYVGDRYDFGLRTVVCEDCGLTFTNPRPTGEWFEAFYRLHYRTYYEDVAKPDEEYLSRDWVRGRQSRNVQWLQRAGLPSEGRLLDVGSAEGTFLRLFEDGFPRWQAQGVEPSADFSAFARSHFGLRNVATARLEDLESWPSEQFDLITINHVLEHLLNPDWFFSTARRMLKTGGHLFIDVPDAESESRGIGNLHIAHVYHFTMASLGNFLAKHGFEVVSSRKGTETPQWTFQIMARKAPEMPEQWKPAGVSVRQVVRSFRRYSGASRGRIGALTRRLGALASKIPRGARPRPDETVARALPDSAGQPDAPARRWPKPVRPWPPDPRHRSQQAAGPRGPRADGLSPVALLRT